MMNQIIENPTREQLEQVIEAVRNGTVSAEVMIADKEIKCD